MARPRKREVAERHLPQNLDDVSALPAHEYKRLINELWVPHLAELMMKELEVALGDGKQASDARARIQDRIVGKVPQQLQQDSSMKIQITVRPVESADAVGEVPAPPTLTLLPESYTVEDA